MLKINFSRFTRCNDTQPKMEALGWAELCQKYLSQHDLRDKKDGAMFSGAIYGGNATRMNKKVEAVSIGVFDFDNADPEQVRQTLTEAGVEAVMYSTHSHTPQEPCFRAVIPFTEPVTGRFWPQLVAAFNEMFDGAIDPKTKPVSQAFYLPSCPFENQNDAFIWSISGDAMDVQSMLADLQGEVEEDEGAAKEPTGSSSKVCPRKLAEEIQRDLFGGEIKYFNHEFYVYANGYWKPQNRSVDIEQRIMRSYKRLNYAIIKQIIENLEVMSVVTDISLARTDTGRLLCLNNGTLVLLSGALLPHSSDHNLIHKMDVSWDPDATAPTFLKALDDIFKFDDDRETRIQFFQEWFGYCLLPDTSQHKFLWLVGPGGNGKSLLLNTLAAVVGIENVSYAMLERMGRPSVRAELQGKLINISHEMSADATIADGYLKAIVAGDMVEAERKFQPSFSYEPFVRINAATNSLPYLKDTTDGFFRRAIILPLTRKFTEADTDKRLQEKILLELPGILVWAVKGLLRMMDRDGFIIPESAIKAAKDYRDESDCVRYFVKEACAVDKKGTKPAELYAQYQRFAAINRLPGLNVIKFGKQLTALGIGSRDSNGCKYWLLDYSDAPADRYSAGSLSDAMKEE